MRALQKIEAALLVAVSGCGLWCLAGWTGPVIYSARSVQAALPDTGLLGRLEIPALAFSSAVVEGTDTVSLRRGVGHIAGTAMPGGLGNVGLAGHRDTVFRPLRGVARGMDIILEDRAGRFHYAVDSTQIVLPEAVEVLGLSSKPELTLITCFPFDFVGSAPKRFVVHAHLRSLVADPAQPTNR